MPLNNKGLETIQEIISPELVIKTQNETKPEENNDTKGANQSPTLDPTPPKMAISTSSNGSSTINTEFIPHIFYSLNNIMKDPNTSNQLETATGVIRHKLRSSKQVLLDNDDTRILLNKSLFNWEKFVQLREQELMMKRNVLQQLNERIKTLDEPTTSTS